MGLNQEKKISFHRILIPLCLTRVCVSIFKPQVGFFDVRKCFTDYCTALSIVTTCQKKRWSKNTRHTFLRANLSRPSCPSEFPTLKKNILGVKLSPQFQVLPPENSHKCPYSVSLYIRHFLSSNPHALSLYEKKNIRESQSSHQNKFFFTMFFPFIRQIDSSNEKILEP